MLAKTSLLFLAVAGFCAAARAELLWENTAQEQTRAYSDPFAEFRFRFKNAGTSPVTITEMHTSCECTTSRLDKAAYAPGEGGEVVARVNLYGRRGTHVQIVKIFTADNPRHPQFLTLTAKVIDPLTVTPQLVFWRVGDANDPRKVNVTVDENCPIHVTGVSSSNPRIAAAFAAVKPGQAYVVTVTPQSTAQKDSAEVAIQTDYPSASPRIVTVHVRIK
jgi:Protein of unknown function (DUF1573)